MNGHAPTEIILFWCAWGRTHIRFWPFLIASVLPRFSCVNIKRGRVEIRKFDAKNISPILVTRGLLLSRSRDTDPLLRHHRYPLWVISLAYLLSKVKHVPLTLPSLLKNGVWPYKPKQNLTIIGYVYNCLRALSDRPIWVWVAVSISPVLICFI